jgi:hypothetical protein
VLVYANDVNLLGDNIDTTKKIIETLIDATKEVALEENTEKAKHMLLSSHLNAKQTHHMKISNFFFKCGTVQIFLKDYNKSKSDSGGNKEETELG